MEVRDARVVRWGWRGVELLGRLVGPHRARWVAAAMWRRTASSDEGFARLALRVSPRLRSANPGLFTVPTTWTGTGPLVQVRRLGLDWELDLRDNLQAVLYFGGTYEPALLRFFCDEVRCGDVVVDVGAHIGVHALTVARRLREVGGGRVVAFEPTSDSAGKLAAAAVRNGLEVDVVRTAVGDRTGSMVIASDPVYGEADAGVRSEFNTGPVVEEVPVTTFDGWAASTGLDRLDLVKIDVEGAEVAVIAGMAQSLRSLRPRAVVVEVKEHGFERSGTTPDVLRRLLAACGYASTGVVLHHNEVYRHQR